MLTLCVCAWDSLPEIPLARKTSKNTYFCGAIRTSTTCKILRLNSYHPFTSDVYGPKRPYTFLLIFEVCIKSALAFRSRSRQFSWRWVFLYKRVAFLLTGQWRPNITIKVKCTHMHNVESRLILVRGPFKPILIAGVSYIIIVTQTWT